MLVEVRGPKSMLRGRADDQSSDLAAPMINVRLIAFIESDEEEAAALKSRTGKQGSDIGLQPGVRLGKGAIVGVIIRIGHDERILRE